MAEVRTIKKQTSNSEPAKSKPQKAVEADLVVKSRFVRMAPDKIRLVGKALIGKDIEVALTKLQFIPKAASVPLSLILKNGQSQAKARNFSEIWIKNIIVDEGPKLKRRRIIHRGRATTILKRMAHITVVLTPKKVSKEK